MIKKVLYISLLSLVTFVTMFGGNASAMNVSYIQETIAATPNSTFKFATFNITGNVIENNSLEVLSTSPFEITHMEYKNGTNSTIIFNAKIPEHISPGVYSGSLKLMYGTESITQDYNITVSEHVSWYIEKQNITLDANSGETVPLYINISNDGNVEVTVSATSSGDCVNYTYAQDSKIIYPNVNNRYLITFDIPSTLSSTTHNCSITFESDNSETVTNVTLNIIDNIAPVLNSSKILDGMAYKPILFEIVASDNAEIKNITAEIYYKNHTVWYVNETRFEEYNNISVSNYSFVKSSRELFILQFPDTERLGTYYLHYKIMDYNGNAVIGVDAFEVVELDAVKYNTSLDVQFIQTDYEVQIDLFELNFKTNVMINVSDIELLDVINMSASDTDNTTVDNKYIIGIMDENNNRRYFKDGVDTLNVSATGKYRLIFTGNVPGRIIGNIQLSTVPQHVMIIPITFTLQIVDFALPYEHFEYMSKMGLNTVCDAENNGVLEETTATCVTTIPYQYLLSDENKIVVTTQKELDDIKMLRDEAKQIYIDENSSLKNTNLLLYTIILFGILGVYLERKLKDVVFIFD